MTHKHTQSHTHTQGFTHTERQLCVKQAGWQAECHVSANREQQQCPMTKPELTPTTEA